MSAAPCTVTVVIPTKNSAGTLGRCLASVAAQSRPPDQIIVVDNHSEDDTIHLALAAGARAICGGPERSAQRNLGWRACRTDAVIFVDSDMVLDPGVVKEAIHLLEANPEVGALVVPEHAFGDGFLAKCRSLEKEIYLGMDSVEAARVYRRQVLEVVGGWDERLTAYEDWDLADRALSTGCTLGRTTAPIWHDEGRIRLRSCFRKKRYYGRWLPRYAAGGGRGIASNGLRRLTGRTLHLLASSPLRASGLAILKMVETAGFLAGAADARRLRSP